STVRFRSDDCWPMCSAQLRSLCPYTTLFRSEYNHGINAPLKNAIDYLHREWQYKPVGFVSYGGVSAGTRAAAAAKQVVTNLKMMPMAETVAIPYVQQFLDDEGNFRPSDVLEQAAVAMLDELARWEEALRPLREAARQAWLERQG